MPSRTSKATTLKDVLAFITQLEAGELPAELTLSNDPLLDPVIEKLNSLSKSFSSQSTRDTSYIVDQLGIGIWKWDLITNALEWDKNMYKLYGADPIEFSGAYDAWESSLTPETKAKAVEEINNAVAGGKSFDTTFKVVHKKTGKVQEVRTRAFIIRDEKGKPTKMWGINLDRTREAELESEVIKALKSLEQTSKLLEQTGEMAKVGGWELDLKTGQVHMSHQTQVLHEIDENYKPPLYSTGSEWYPPEVWPTIQAAVKSAIEEQKSYDLEAPFITATGRRIWVRVQGIPVVEQDRVIGLRGTFQDITDRKNAEMEKQKTDESLAIYKAVLDNSSDFIGIANNNWVPTYCNPAGRKMLGIPLEKNISEVNVSECYPDSLRETILKEIVETLQKNGNWSGETYFQHFETKELIPVHDVHFTVKDPETGASLGHATITRDISKERSLQLQAIHQSKLASLGELSAGVAHEINNPLAVILGNLNLLKRFKDDENMFDSKIESLLKSAKRIEKIIKGLRKFSRTSDKTVRTIASIEGIVNETLTLTEAKAKEHFVQITSEVESGLTIECDSIEIEQVLVNLINNSIDAIKTQNEKWVKVKVFKNSGEVLLQVIDSGKCISSEIEAKMFQPFFTTKAVGEGTGLGLSIVKGILDTHKATIAINRTFSTTCFEIRFPCATQSRITSIIS